MIYDLLRALSTALHTPYTRSYTRSLTSIPRIESSRQASEPAVINALSNLLILDTVHTLHTETPQGLKLIRTRVGRAVYKPTHATLTR